MQARAPAAKVCKRPKGIMLLGRLLFAVRDFLSEMQEQSGTCRVCWMGRYYCVPAKVCKYP